MLPLQNGALQGIQELYEKKENRIEPLWALIEKWLERFKSVPAAPIELTEHICDPSTALVGYRSPAQHVICSLHGEHTGLGVLRYGAIDIVSYGPQYLPLGECQGFGIEGNALSDHGHAPVIDRMAPAHVQSERLHPDGGPAFRHPL